MKLWIDISSPTQFFQRTGWNGLVMPAIGDFAVYRQGDQAWAFQVLKRTVAIGIDPVDLQPVTHVVLRVDSEPPVGFQP